MIMMDDLKIPASAVCLECGDSIAYGRIGKKFCSSACKNRYHNRCTHEQRSIKLRVLNTLDRNYAILESLLNENRTSIPIGDAAVRGFNKEFVTSSRRVGSHVECGCYDIKYFCSSTRLFNIRRLGR